LDHAQAVVGRREAAVEFMWRETPWDKDDALETQAPKRLLGHHEVSEVDRIERAT